jgi:hypothetical protein
MTEEIVYFLESHLEIYHLPYKSQPQSNVYLNLMKMIKKLNLKMEARTNKSELREKKSCRQIRRSSLLAIGTLR